MKDNWYKGNFINGTIAYSDRSYYQGRLLNNKKHGDNCEFTFPDGDKFIGEFSEDEFKQGTLEYANGVYYKGTFRNGVKDGHGVYKLKGVMEYEGGFKEGEYHGKG